MIPVYLQLPHRPQTRVLSGFAPEDAPETTITEHFCLGRNISRVTVNRGERCWVIVALEVRDAEIH